MKFALLILMAAVAFSSTTVLAAKEKAPVAKKSVKKSTKKSAKKASAFTPISAGQGHGKSLKSEPKLSRDVVFDGAMVSGHYHSAGEAVTKVEQEKQMNDLIGMRRDFKDRLTAERERLKRGEAASAQ